MTRSPTPVLSRHTVVTTGRWTSVLAVVLATLGCAPTGPNIPKKDSSAWQYTLTLPGEALQKLGYLKAGDPNGTRLILIHGTPGSADGWVNYLDSPPPGFEVVALDRPGFGRSGPPGAVTSLADQAAAVVALLPVDGRPAVLLGHSLGGPIAAWVAAEHPGRVSAVILLAASLDPAQEKTHPMQYVGAWPVIRSVLPRAIRNANAELMALEPQLLALQPMLARITAPVHIVHGTLDDLVPVANVPYMQAHLSGSSCVKTTLLEGRNHFLPWNAEAQVREAIAASRQPC